MKSWALAILCLLSSRSLFCCYVARSAGLGPKLSSLLHFDVFFCLFVFCCNVAQHCPFPAPALPHAVSAVCCWISAAKWRVFHTRIFPKQPGFDWQKYDGWCLAWASKGMKYNMTKLGRTDKRLAATAGEWLWSWIPLSLWGRASVGFK